MHTTNTPHDKHPAETTTTEPPTGYRPPALTDLGALRPQTFGSRGSIGETRQTNRA